MIHRKHGFSLLALSAAIASTAQAQVTTNPDSANTTEGVPVTIDVLANDTTDVFQGSVFLTLPISSQPSKGELVYDEETGLHTYTPNPGELGEDTFTYEAGDDDEYGEPVLGTVTITITADTTDEVDLEDQVSGENNKEVATAISTVCDVDNLSDDLHDQICVDFGDNANEAVSQVTPEETLLLRRMNTQAARSHSTRLFKHQSSLRSGGIQRAISFDDQSLSLKGYYGGSAGDDLPAKASVYATLHSEGADYDGTDREAGHEYTTSGLTLGGDYRLRPQLFIGAALGLIEQDLDYDHDAGKLDADITTFTGYLSYFHNDLNIDMQLTYGQGEYEITRSLDFFSHQAKGKTDGDQYALSTQIDWSLGFDSWKFNPFARLEYFKVKIDSYQESGGGGLALNVGDQEQDQINASMGVDIQYTRSYSWGVLIPNFTASVVSESSANYDPVSFSFIDDDSGTTFELRPDQEDSLYYEYQVGAIGILQGGISCFANYTRTVSLNDMAIYRVNLGIRSEL